MTELDSNSDNLAVDSVLLISVVILRVEHTQIESHKESSKLLFEKYKWVEVTLMRLSISLTYFLSMLIFEYFFLKTYFEPITNVQNSCKSSTESFFFFAFLPFFKKNFYWSIVDLQCCVSFRCTAKWINYTYTYIHSFFSFLDSFPYRPLQSTE